MEATTKFVTWPTFRLMTTCRDGRRKASLFKSYVLCPSHNRNAVVLVLLAFGDVLLEMSWSEAILKKVLWNPRSSVLIQSV